MSNDGAEHFGGLIQSPVKQFYLESIGEMLGFLEVLRLDKGVVQKEVGEAFSLQKAGQVMVAIKVELQPEGSPGWHPQITQPQIFQNEVEIVMDALGLRAPKKRLAGLFIMPGFKGRTGLHGREDMDEARMVPPLGDDLLDLFFLTKILLPDKLDLQSILLGQLLGPQADFIPQGFDILGIIENSNTLGSQMAGHGLGIANIRQCSRNHDPVKTRENPSNFVGISFYQHGHGSILPIDTNEDSLWYKEHHEKVKPYFALRSLIAPASLASPLLGEDEDAGKCLTQSRVWIPGLIRLQQPCLVPATPG